MARFELVDGIVSAANREVDFHPKQLDGKTVITAWKRRQGTLIRHADAIESLERKVAELEKKIEQGATLPF